MIDGGASRLGMGPGGRVNAGERLRARLDAVMGAGASGLTAANELCLACVDLLGVDGAAISYVHNGSSRGTFGSSGDLSRRLDEFEFTFGEGPCHDAVGSRRPVLVPDLATEKEQRWPAFARALLDDGVRAVFAAPVMIASSPVAALDLFRLDAGVLDPVALAGFLHAAELAALPLLDLMSSDLDWPAAGDGPRDDGWAQLASLERVEVYQATGMIMGQLDIGPAEALVRLRGHAFAHSQTASDAAWEVLNRTLAFREDKDTAS